MKHLLSFGLFFNSEFQKVVVETLMEILDQLKILNRGQPQGQQEFLLPLRNEVDLKALSKKMDGQHSRQSLVKY